MRTRKNNLYSEGYNSGWISATNKINAMTEEQKANLGEADTIPKTKPVNTNPEFIEGRNAGYKDRILEEIKTRKNRTTHNNDYQFHLNQSDQGLSVAPVKEKITFLRLTEPINNSEGVLPLPNTIDNFHQTNSISPHRIEAQKAYEKQLKAHQTQSKAHIAQYKAYAMCSQLSDNEAEMTYQLKESDYQSTHSNLQVKFAEQISKLESKTSEELRQMQMSFLINEQLYFNNTKKYLGKEKYYSSLMKTEILTETPTTTQSSLSFTTSNLGFAFSKKRSANDAGFNQDDDRSSKIARNEEVEIAAKPKNPMS